MKKPTCPYRQYAGFVMGRLAILGGWIVVYDRKAGLDCDADQRWIVMHEPSSGHVEVKTRAEALWIMGAVAMARSVREAQVHADILPGANDAQKPKVGDFCFMTGDFRPLKVVAVDDANKETTLGFASIEEGQSAITRFAPIRWEHFVWDDECDCWRIGGVS